MKRIAIVAVLVVGLAMSSVALAASTFSGTYKTKIHSTALGGALNGKWTIKFKGGHYTVKFKGKLEVKGNYLIKGQKVTVHDTSGPGKCPGTGTYKFKATGNKLRFTKISDSNPACLGRVTVLKGTFTKVS